MGLHYILGASGAGKTYTLYNKMIQESIKHPKEEFLIIVPEQFTLQTQKDLVSMHERHGIMNIDVLSFLRLAFRVFEETGENDRIILEDTGKSMIVKKVVLNKKSELKLFSTNVRKQGFIEELKSIISELYQYSIGMEEFEQMLELSKNKSALHNKLQDIKTVYQGFQEFLQEKYITNEEIFEVLGNVLAKSSFVKQSTICLDGYTGFTPSQYKLLRGLLRHAKEVYITVTIDGRALQRKQLEHQLFYLSNVTMEKLSKIATEEKQDITFELLGDTKTPYRYRESTALAFLERNLFRFPYEIYKEEQEDIILHIAKDREEEAANTAIEINRLIRDAGYRYRDIAVISGDINGYGALMQRKLDALNIPCFVDEKQSILSNPLSELLRGILAVIQYDYTYDSVLHLLKSGLLSWSFNEIDILENYVIALGIRGRYRWKNEWKRIYRTSYHLNIEEINRLRMKFVDMMEPLERVFLNKESSVKDFITALYYFFKEQEVEEKLFVFSEEKKSKADIESRLLAKEYEQVYRLVIEMFDRIAELLGEDILPLDEFREIIETGLSEAKVGLIPPGTDQIVVGDIERTRLKDIKILFFVGVNDGIVPKANTGGGILSDVDRQFLSDHEVELAPTRRQSAYMTDFYLYLNLTKPQNKLYLSYYKVDMEGKTARPSALISKIYSIFKAMKPSAIKENLLGTDGGFTYLSNCLRESKEIPLPPYFYELFRMYSVELKKKEEVMKLIKAAFYSRTEAGISKKAAAELYGNTLLGSVTRMEQYASCAFKHFLSFGLSLEERAEYRIAMPDIGNIYHLSLEQFAEKLKKNGLTWHTVSEEQRLEFGTLSVLEAAASFGNGILDSSSRNAYLVKKVERVFHRTTKTIKEQISAGVFEPAVYEHIFLYADQYLNLKGRIDRMDLYEENGKIYVQIVDYKSGSKKFDLESLYYGLQLQLGVYLNAGLNYVQQLHKDMEAVPAGVFYYNIDDPIVDKSEAAEEEIKKCLAMNGLANSSAKVLPMLDTGFYAANGGLMPSVKSVVIPVETNKDGIPTKKSSVADENQFHALLEFVDDKIHSLGKEIMDGETKLNPYKTGNQTACDYCEFSTVCGFDTKLAGSAYHKLRAISDDEIWDIILNKNNRRGKHELDSGATTSN